jgi:hypothetical protein
LCIVTPVEIFILTPTTYHCVFCRSESQRKE